MTRLTIVLITLIIQLQVLAAPEDLQSIKSTIEHYNSAPAVSANLKKTITLIMLDETKMSEGTLLYSKGKLRLDIKKPEASLIVMNKNIVWIATTATKELGGKTQVLKIKMKNNVATSKAPIAALLSSSKAWDQFLIKNVKTEESTANKMSDEKLVEFFSDKLV